MFAWRENVDARNSTVQAAAVDRRYAVVEYSMDGKVLKANNNFLRIFGYSLNEVVGNHHSMFVQSAEQQDHYLDFWAKLNRGESQAAEYKRLDKGSREIWVEAFYSPVLDSNGKTFKVIEFATDVTQKKRRSMEHEGKIEALSRTQAVIEFNMDGTIETANDNFLKAMGYTLEEIKNRHHSMFVDPAERANPEYQEFWARLNRGERSAAEYKRIGKSGKEVWILASYNPIFDERSRPFKVIKFATDITEQKLNTANFSGQICAIGKSQAVIEFEVDGTVITANSHFLEAVGYSLDEIRGRHHSMFVDSDERDAETYRDFWATLRRGDYQSGEFKRLRRDGRPVWIQASYNPILDLNGTPFKVVKYATDITKQVMVRKGNERVGSMMASVAAGAEELSASVREISEAMAKSQQTASNAVERVDHADAQAKQLSSAAEAMSGIVKMISEIAGQINLLALNATIESARAGEAGRGFAVVAAEVKNLANQAKKATDKITTEIGALNGISSQVVEALATIKHAIQDVSEYVTSTAVAIEQQSVVAGEMSSSMQKAALEAASIGRHVA